MLATSTYRYFSKSKTVFFGRLTSRSATQEHTTAFAATRASYRVCSSVGARGTRRGGRSTGALMSSGRYISRGIPRYWQAAGGRESRIGEEVVIARQHEVDWYAKSPYSVLHV